MTILEFHLTLNINKQQEYKSVFWRFPVLIYILILDLIGIFQRDNYIIEVQQLQDMDPDLKEMNSQNFMFAIKVDNPFMDRFPNIQKNPFSIQMSQGYKKNGIRTKNITKILYFGNLYNRTFSFNKF